MTTMNYIGLDVHKKTISYCVKDVSGHVQQEGEVGSTRRELDCWMRSFATALDSGDGGDDLQRLDLRSPAAACAQIKVAHPLMLRAIAAAKKKNDQIDASEIADGLRCDFLPKCTR